MTATTLLTTPPTAQGSTRDHDTPPTLHPGLAGVHLATTRLSRVDGERGRLTLAGFELEEIAPQATFEEMIFLLGSGRLPLAGELEALRRALAERRALPGATLDLLRAAAQRDLDPMEALRMATASLDLADSVGGTVATILDAAGLDAAALGTLARIPGVVAAFDRLRRGEEPLAPRPELGLAADFLARLRGSEPSAAAVRALDTYLCTVVDHGLNASTFTARVIVATGSDLLSAVVGALGALKGPLHGGAPGPALDTVLEIGTPERAEPVLRAKLAAGERLMGFGHRVYRVRDPRAEVLCQAAAGFFEGGEGAELYALAGHVERVALDLLAEHKPDRKLETNVEFYTALLLHGLGLPSDLFTPVFAMGRTAGWIAHGREQREEGRLIRPRLHYVGPEDRPWVDVERRSVGTA